MPEKRADARPKRKRDAAATREAILEAATRRFATQGYERRGPRDRRGRRGDRRAGQPLLRLQGGALRRGDQARPRHGATAPGRAGGPGGPPRPGRGVRGGGRTGRAADAVAAPAAFRRGAPRDRAVPAGPRPHPAPAPRRAHRRRRRRGPGRHGPRPAQGFAVLHHVLRPEAFADARGEELVALLSKSLAACIG